MRGKVLYVRNFACKVNLSSYNLQEVGLGKALVRQGFDCDIIYYDDRPGSKVEEIYRFMDASLRILWMKGIKFLSNSIYTKLLNKSFLDQYDLIITTEYNQIMTFLLSRLCSEKLLLYHGPYKDNTNFAIRKVYDYLLLPFMRKKIKHSFVKSDLAKFYLQQKGFDNVFTLGVGLDRDTFEQSSDQVNPEIEKKLEPIKNNKTLVYVGVLEERRNIIFLLKVFKKLLELDSDYRMIIVGQGKKEETDKYWDFIYQNQIENQIVYLPKVDQKNLWQIFKASDLMLFPTNYDIFGMVLLECLYFGVPVLSSMNGGSSLLSQRHLWGLTIEDLEESKWVNQVIKIMADNQFKERIKPEQVCLNFSWDRVAENLLERTAFTTIGGGQYEGLAGS